MKQKLFTFFVFFLFSSFSYSYTWSNSSVSNIPYPSPAAVYDAHYLICVSAHTSCKKQYFAKSNDTRWNYTILYQLPADSSWYYYANNLSVNRSGSSCPSSLPDYDTDTGECNSNEPEQTACEINSGQIHPFQRSGTAPDSFYSLSSDGKFFFTDQTSCFSGCRAFVYNTRCTNASDKTYTCKGELQTLSEECETLGATDPIDAPPVVEATDDPIPPVPQKIEIIEPCVYLARSDGSLACRSIVDVSLEGMSCGLGPDGQTVCSSSDPSRKGRTIDTTVTTISNADGTSSTVKEDISTYVTCVGVKCDTKITTSKTITETDGSGNTTSSTSTCTGPDCKGNSSEGGTADAECTVDCSDEDVGEFSGAELGDVAGFGESVGDFIDRISASPIMTSISGIGLSGGGSCSFPSASTAYFSVDMNIICENSNWLQPLYYIMLAFWAFAAVRVFLSA